VARLREALACPEALAWALERRGLSDPDEAREFLAADGALDPPTALSGVSEAARRLAGAIDKAEQIVVHGDYDCDGVSSTAMLTRTLRARGARVEPFLPSRFTDGYGVSVPNVERLAGDGAQLLVCVDCGTTAEDALCRARDLGMDTIVLDHHLAGGRRPPGIIANPALGRQEGALPAAAGVVLKVVRALAELDGSGTLGVDPLDELDLAALATVADAVPLRDENRRIVAQGIATIRERPRVGIRALLAAAAVDPHSTDARTLGYTLGPAINAAGRIDHPSRALDLLLETDMDAARPAAQRLWELNSERREIERRITDEAMAQFEAYPEEVRSGAAIVVGGEGWHEGVVGIVASRLTERYERPAIVISIDGDAAKGSGRSVPGVDLHELVSRADGALAGWGGHEGAVGLQLASADIPVLRRDLLAVAEQSRAAIERSRVKTVDAVVSGSDLSLSGAEAFEALAPFGRGNPSLSLLIPGARIRGVSTVGEGGRHLRLGMVAGGVTSRAIGFSMGHRAAALDPEVRHDVVAGLGIERWQDTVGPRVTLRGIDPLPEREPGGDGLRSALRRDAPLRDLRTSIASDERPARAGIAPLGVVDARGTGALARIVALTGADEGVIAVAANAALREAALSTVLAPHRLDVERLMTLGAERDPRAAIELLGDPPASAEQSAALLAVAAGRWLHLSWGPEETAFAREALTARGDLRGVAREIWGALDGARTWRELADACAGPLGTPGIRAVGCALTALEEAGLVRLGDGGVERVDGGARADLSATPTGRRVAEETRAGLDYLERADTLDLSVDPDAALAATGS
jgi:single-stranded-DNA-specific exonuclease RecJ